MYDQHQDPFRDREYREPGRQAPGPLARGAGILAGALLFGVVAGGVMTGVNGVLAPLLPGNNSEQAAVYGWTVPGEQPQPEQTVRPVQAPAGVPARTYSVEEIAQMAMPSVVAIASTAEYEAYDPFGSWFFGQSQPRVYQASGSGSGIILGENQQELLIATNYHVIENATALKVSFVDQEAAEAVVKGTDPQMDLAVISVRLEDMKASTREAVSVAVLGDSGALKPGQGVVAIGNALGYGQSVTVGYISALDRRVEAEDGTVRRLLQTDAAINPGNSGGALLNMQGQVIGINSAKYSSTDVEGMSYAIPISSAQEILGELMNRRSQNPVPQEKRGYLESRAPRWISARPRRWICRRALMSTRFSREAERNRRASEPKTLLPNLTDRPYGVWPGCRRSWRITRWENR